MMERAHFAEGHVFAGETVAEVWVRALASLMAKGSGGERSSVVFVVEGAEDDGPGPAREALDAYLASESETSVEEVAGTVFPLDLWRLHGRGGRAEFFAAYRRALPWLRRGSKKARRANRRGIYFARMVAFDEDPETGRAIEGTLPDDGNQLETVLRLYEKGQEIRDGRRQSVQRIKLQVGIFDPRRDHTSGPYLPFPCLQHVTFEPHGESGVLRMSAFYATQQLVRKAYGNLLGLRRLQAFMAGEMGLTPGRLTVLVGVEKLGVPKTHLDAVLDAARVGAGGAET